uniref:Poly [ADP-ribose] polymerase n=1 Tax=Takifugu rubripes TaxID=31033 RepID=A0A674PIM8_TAKRU
MEVSHDLLVELEENNICRLKNKLLRYFQSKKSNGGECEVDYKEGDRTAVLRFRREQDQKGVLEKGSHEITVDKCVLKMTVRLLTNEATVQATSSHTVAVKSDIGDNQAKREECVPAPEGQAHAGGGNDETAAEAACPTSALLANVPENNQNFLKLLVHNILKDGDSKNPVFSFEFLPDMTSAVVTFQSGKEASDFVTRCPQNARFIKMGLLVQLLEVTHQVLVEGAENIGKEFLALYFENAGGEVESVVVDEVDQSAIITFKEQKAAQNILKKKHTIDEKEIQVFAFHKSLGTALYGQEKPRLTLPKAINKAIDCAVWTYINSNQGAAESIHSALKEHFCIVNLDRATVCLSPAPTLKQHKNAKAIINQWGENVEATFVQSVSKFRCLNLSPESEAWEESTEVIRQMLLKEDVAVVSDKAKGVISVAGPVDVVEGVEQSLYEATNKIRKRVQRQKLSKTETVKMPPALLNILFQGGVKEELLSVYPELEISNRNDSPDLIVTGLMEEIVEVQKLIFNRMSELKYQKLDMDPFVLELLKEEQEEKLTDMFLRSHGINAALKISGNTLQLVAVTDGALVDAEDHLGKLLMSQYVDVEDSNVLKTPEWDEYVRQAENANNKLASRIRIRIKDQQVVVSGHKAVVINVSRELEDFLKQNAHVEEMVAIKPDIILKHIKAFDKSHMEKLQDKVALSYKYEAICLSGSRADVLKSKSLVEKLVSSLIFETYVVSVPGAKKLFQNLDSMNLLFNATGCLVELVDGTSGQGKPTNVPKALCQLQTVDGTEIFVCKADICSYPVHAVVSYANPDFRFTSGLQRALLKAAGPQLQEDCDRLIHLKGRLKPGDNVITAAGGQLCCRNIIHAVAPKLDGGQIIFVKRVAQLKKAIKGSLELAEKKGCVSVALPALSITSGFLLKLSVDPIITAVREYFDERHNNVVLKRVHFVDTCDENVAKMAAAVREQFKDHCAPQASSSSPNLPSTTTSTSAGNQTPSNPNCLGQVQTKEGLNITLVVGNIEDATTDVTVNSVFNDLDLNRGALSRALLHAAGLQLQDFLKAQNSSGTLGEIIVTEGCQLKSMFVYHAVTPASYNAQAVQALGGIFRDCLKKAEDSGMTSISFPSIGTGGLGFPKDLAAQMLYDEILKFSSKRQTKRLAEVTIILYSGDTETQQAFTAELKKKISKDTVSGHFSKIVSSSGMYETKIGSVTIQAVTGDITKETTDVIVNSSNNTFSLKKGVSKAILKAAGQAVEDECQKLAASPNAGIIMTQPGNLQCKKIVHVTGQNKAFLISKVVKSALQMCVANSYTSVSFPAIGTGQGNIKATEVADAMFDAVIDELRQNSSTTLNTVRIVVFKPPMLNDFYTSMQQREASATKSASWLSKIKAFFTSSADKPQKEGGFIKSVEVEPVCFHICGKSQAAVDSAKKKINDLISKERSTNTIANKDIRSLSQADHQRLTDIQTTLNVKIMDESQKGTPSLTIEGLGYDVLKATNEILEMLGKAREREDLKVKMKLAESMAAWQYQQGNGFQNFDSTANYELEEALVNNVSSVDITIQGQLYTVQMPSGPATDKQGNSLQIRRTDKDEDIPNHWDVMPDNTSCHSVTLAAGSEEYKQVERKFQATCGQTIISIERIQNPLVWKTLQIKKRNMEQKNGHQNNERILFHGTSEETIATINANGFNRSYAGKNAALYGNGTYFAVSAQYSADDLYSTPNQNGDKHMYLCRVLTGDHTLGQQGMVAPLQKTSNSVELFDSAVDNQANPHIFVIFSDNQAYPEYLIKFK